MTPTPEEDASALAKTYFGHTAPEFESLLAAVFRERDAAVYREAQQYWPEMKINAARREQREKDEQIALSHRNVTAQLIAVDIRNGHAKEFVEPWHD